MRQDFQELLADVAATQHWIAAPPPREKIRDPDGNDQTMLEDESGRLRLVGTPLQTLMLVTGCIVAVMGTENANGDFEIIDLKVPDLPRQPQRWERDEADAKSKLAGTKSPQSGNKVAIVSGLAFSGDAGDTLTTDLLMEYLLGEAGVPQSQREIAKVSRLIIAGDSINQGNPLNAREEVEGKKSSKKYGYDSSAYNPAPTRHLDDFLANLLPSIPITLIPGESDPANVSLPQQPLHSAMFPRSRNYGALPDTREPGWFDSTTNPWEGDIDGWRFMGNGGQPVDDMFKYVEGDDRLEMMEHLLRWRCGAPTAPDTLCEYFQSMYQYEHPSNGFRVLSFPRQGSIRDRGVSTCLFRWLPASVRYWNNRGSHGSDSPLDCDPQIQGNGRDRSA